MPVAMLRDAAAAEAAPERSAHLSGVTERLSARALGLPTDAQTPAGPWQTLERAAQSAGRLRPGRKRIVHSPARMRCAKLGLSAAGPTVGLKKKFEYR